MYPWWMNRQVGPIDRQSIKRNNISNVELKCGASEDFICSIKSQSQYIALKEDHLKMIIFCILHTFLFFSVQQLASCKLTTVYNACFLFWFEESI